MRVLRITSVFETPDDVATRRGGGFDPIGGMQTHTAALTRVLDLRGVEQTVLTTRPPGTRHTEQRGGAIQVRRIGAPVPWLRQGFAAAAAATLPSSLPWYDVVHVHVGEDPGVLALAAGLVRSRTPVVMTLHSSLRHTVTPHGLRSRLAIAAGGRLEALVKQRVGALITLTGAAAAAAVDDGADATRVHVIPSGFEESRFAAPVPDPRVAALPRPVVGFLGRLHPQKDVETLLRATKILRGVGSVVIVGDGPDARALRTLADELRLHDRVHFLGAVPHDQVPGVLTAFDVLAMPSRYEELGSVAVEAMRVGLPVVATRTGGLTEAVQDGRTGFLVPPRNPIMLAAALNHILGEPAVAAHLSARARERAAEYSWTELSRRVLDVYRSVTGRRLPPSGSPLLRGINRSVDLSRSAPVAAAGSR
jgi:glycosyltransferase involved in cell wall biosynthesis